ncbi:hypothetical protein BpHYR1_051369 [Brachionus plicatilis]|uniref:Uncharacterized protein n=1 Tax=Brachionus plicatilis TaxID=10195 RepID=A0A3M7RKS0_BRAPC|nr:hypothetical protein BpHYR1_051369 [Brachionus plicatilis]
MFRKLWTVQTIEIVQIIDRSFVVVKNFYKLNILDFQVFGKTSFDSKKFELTQIRIVFVNLLGLKLLKPMQQSEKNN